MRWQALWGGSGATGQLAAIAAAAQRLGAMLVCSSCRRSAAQRSRLRARLLCMLGRACCFDAAALAEGLHDPLPPSLLPRRL